MNEVENTAGIMLVETEGWFRQTPGILDSLDTMDREQILAIGRPATFNADEALWKQGDPHEGIYIITAGRVRTFYFAPSGREVTLAYWFAGNFVGGPSLFGGPRHIWCSSAVQDTAAIFLPGEELHRVTSKNANIAMVLLEALSFKARCYSAMAQMMGTRSATERLNRLISFLATAYGMSGPDGTMIGVSFTHAELASLIGSTRQWVTVQLAQLQDKKILRYNRGLIVVLDLPALERSASSR